MSLRLVLAMLASVALAACSRDRVAQSPLATAQAEATHSIVEPEAVQALARMISYLRTLDRFEVVSETSTDHVLDDGFSVQFAGRVTYRVRKPNAFAVDVRTDRRWRQFFYNGRVLTMVAPRSGFYTEIAAPPSITGALQVAASDYGIALPLTDLFIWSGPNQPSHAFVGATTIGYASVAGVGTTHYAFREGDLDWQLWIERGAHPLPRQVVITNLSDDSRPTYTARLSWNLNPRFNAGNFEFRASDDNRRIPINLIVAEVGVADATR
jgi:hypothetical protein